MTHTVTQKQITKLPGMNTMYRYKRLGLPIKINPTLLFFGKIKSMFLELKLYDIFFRKQNN